MFEEDEEDGEEVDTLAAWDCIVVLTVSRGYPIKVPTTPAEKPADASTNTDDEDEDAIGTFRYLYVMSTQDWRGVTSHDVINPTRYLLTYLTELTCIPT